MIITTLLVAALPFLPLAPLTTALDAAPAAVQPAGKGPDLREDQPKPAPTLLDKLAPLSGTWEMTQEGKQVVALVSRVTSNGSVFAETMFPGEAHEMTNMYHMDGSNLVITHYCAMGNQPRMKCTGEKSPGVLEFNFESATNMKPTDKYMGKLVLTITDNDHIRQEWTSFKDGKAITDHSPKFDLVRKK